MDLDVAALQPWLDWALENRWLVAIAAALLLLIAWLVAAGISAQRRRAEILQALDNSSRGTLQPGRRQGWLDVQSSIRPAPEPFADLSVEYALRGRGRLPALSGPLGLRRQQLALYGNLRQRPAAEVVWERGRVPDRALGRSPESGLWTAHRLDFLAGAYAVHGANTPALEHAFVDLTTRFGSHLRRVVVQANTNPQVVVLLVVNKLNPEDVPALVATVCALARASLVQ